MKEILETFKTRISSPLFGYTVIALFAINWKVIFYLFAGEATTLERIKYFDSNTTYYTLLIFPLLFAFIYPWFYLFFLYICKIPTKNINLIQIHHEHSMLLARQQLEKTRTSMFEDLEKEKLGRAARNIEIEKIEDPREKEKVRAEIDRLRKERDKLRLDLYEDTGKKIVNDRNKLLNTYSQLELVRNLMKDNPDEYRIKYANLLNNYAKSLVSAGYKAEADKYYSEEQEVRKLIEKNER